MSGQQPQRARGRGGRGQQRPQGDGDAPRQWGPSRGRGGPRPGPPQGGGAWGPTPGGSQQQQQQQPANAPTWGPRPAGAWAPRPQQQPQQGFGQQGHADAASVQSAGRAARRVDEIRPGEQQVAMQVGGGGDVGTGMATKRGGIRGRREIKAVDIMTTKPTTIQVKQATDGSKIQLASNFFKLEKVPEWTLYQYRVDFAPEVDNIRARKGMARTGLKDHLPAHIFDGTILYSSRRLSMDPFEVFVQSNKGEAIRITLRLCQDVRHYEPLNIQIFNLIMRNCLRYLNLQLVKRSYFDAGAAQKVENHRFEVWPGYDTSIRQYEHSVMMNVEIISKCMRIDTALDFLNECHQNDRGNYQDSFAREIIGSVVITKYNNKTYMVDDVDWTSKPTSRFQRKDGSEISYIEYFQTRYKDLCIRDKGQPMLVSRSKAREIRSGMPETVYLVPELCTMTGLTNSQRSNFQFMSALAKHTRISPQDRVNKLRDFHKRLASNPDIQRELRQWDIKFSNELVHFEGRCLAREQIKYHSDSIPAAEDASWTRDLQKQRMLYEAPLTNEHGGWVVMCTRHDVSDVNKFIECITRAAHGMGWRIPKPRDVVVTNDDRTGTLLAHLDEIITHAKPQLIFNAISGNKPDRYNAIKKKCYVETSTANQVVLGRTMKGKAAMSAATKVAIQMNCKLGGAPWSVSLPPDTMFVGFDVCHDPKDRTKNYAAMVAMLDQRGTQYYSNVQSHFKGEEISNYFGTALAQAMKSYQKLNKVPPGKVVIYRDGVGDGQIPFILEHEVDHIKSVLKRVFENAEPKMAFNIVTKRISTRMFSTDRTGRYFNPPPGTVVDDVVTLPERYDFFLVSQCVRQGTVTPTSYNVIHDTTGFTASQMQRMTHKLTHMYFNWSGTIRVPAPCQYAHKLAFMASQNLQRAPNAGISHTLFYL
ncbi:piwi-like protein Siwi [Onthophagus taurus]|uniref:piwi-like protein Siwi n=1 Tax=Onthophagus taurus TaxID=166361 RepID=UPI000C20DB91|nr:piwi-like protein Siwi [Onthophagus taurus]XP_022902157.1 piwi-like protein Siwi [Onthophagus taurus]